jgi:hypothetical protein
MEVICFQDPGGYVVRFHKLTHRRGRLPAVLAAATIVGALALASSAAAEVHHPKGEFAIFADCPLTNPTVSSCLVAKTESGEFVVGKSQVPITNPVTLQAGVHAFASGEESIVAAEDGNTLSKSPQKVPGGLAGLVRCNEIGNFIERLACELTFENGVTGVNATTELAAPASSIKLSTAALLGGVGTALELPVKLHLENPFLGSNCYVGSNAHPILIDFTTGTTAPPAPNKPISGSPGEISFAGEEQILVDSNNVLVNNSFPAPGAEGCGGLFSFLVDPIVNSKLGLPAAAGHNTAILKGVLKVASTEAVKASE